jgi:hypothetical protein
MGNARRTSCWATCSSWPALARFGYVGVLCQPVWDFRVSCHSELFRFAPVAKVFSVTVCGKGIPEPGKCSRSASARARVTRPEAGPERAATLYSYGQRYTYTRTSTVQHL